MPRKSKLRRKRKPRWKELIEELDFYMWAEAMTIEESRPHRSGDYVV